MAEPQDAGYDRMRFLTALVGFASAVVGLIAAIVYLIARML